MPTRQAITASKIAACGGMSEDTRRRWTDVHKLLSPGPDFTEHDAIETAVATALTDRTTTHRAPEVFRELRAQLRREVFAGRTNIWLVIPAKVGAPKVAHSPGAAARAAARLDGLSWTVPLDEPIKLASTPAKNPHPPCVGPLVRLSAPGG
jgi:hypothetical protein